MWKSEDSFGESAPSFHPVGPKEWIELSLEGTVVGPRDYLPISVNFWLVWSSVWNVYELLSVTATSCPDMTFHIILSRHLLLHSASSPVMSVSLGRSENVADKGWLANKDAPPLGAEHSVSQSHPFRQLFTSVLTVALCKEKFPWPRLRAAQACGYTHKYLEGDQIKLLKAGDAAHGPILAPLPRCSPGFDLQHWK